MAAPQNPVILGIDVSKEWLDINVYGQDDVHKIDNAKRPIHDLLKRYRGALIALESTNTYHKLAVERAIALGITVYLIDGRRLKSYAEAVGQRFRNDAIDAKLIARYLAHEQHQLRPFKPRSAQLDQLRTLLKRRASLVQERVAHDQRFVDFKGFAKISAQLKSMRKALCATIKAIDAAISELIHSLGYTDDFKRLQAIPGIGPLNAAMLVSRYHCGDFTHHDAFVSFLGIDVRTKDSGKHKGRRKLTKHGDGEARRLIYLAAETASRTGQLFEQRYKALLDKGMKPTAAYIVVARKLIKIAFAILAKKISFDPARVFGRKPAAVACTPTQGAS